VCRRLVSGEQIKELAGVGGGGTFVVARGL